MPTPIADWLLALDADSHTIVRTEWAVEAWEAAEYEAFARDGVEGRVPYFTPERGAGQGDTSSPATWVVFFDIVLRALGVEDTDPFLTVDLTGHSTPVPDCSFVDDLMSLTSSLAGLQKKADMMAAVSCILGLTIAKTKLRVFSMDWSLNARQARSL